MELTKHGNSTHILRLCSCQLGTTTTGEFTLSAAISDDNSSINVRASNGVGEIMYFRSSVKLITNNE